MVPSPARRPTPACRPPVITRFPKSRMLEAWYAIARVCQEGISDPSLADPSAELR